jgi:hypothetical protein
MRCRLWPLCVATAGYLLFPVSAGAESQVSAAGAKRAAATARVDFRIVIAPALSLALAADMAYSGPDTPLTGVRIAIGGNGRTVSLGSTGVGVPGHHIILNASGHRTVAGTVLCAADPPTATRTVCTISTP